MNAKFETQQGETIHITQEADKIYVVLTKDGKTKQLEFEKFELMRQEGPLREFILQKFEEAP